MKRILAMALAAIMTVGTLAGCSGGSSSKEEKPAENAQTEAAAETEETAEAESGWPYSSVQLEIAAAAGGGTDLITRHLLKYLSKHGDFVVVNNTDGSGAVAFQEVYDTDPAKLDKILVYNTGYFTAYITGVTDLVPFEDLVPVVGLNPAGVYYVVVPKDSPFNSIQDVVDYCKENPGKLNFGVMMGDITHIIAGNVAGILGVEWSYTACGSDGDRVSLLMGNNLDITVLNQITVENYIQSDDIKVLCSLQGRSSTASEKLAATPTLEEEGYEPCKIKTPISVFVPAGTSEADMKKINELFTAAAQDQEVIDGILEMGDALEPFGDLEQTQATFHEIYDAITETCDAIGFGQ